MRRALCAWAGTALLAGGPSCFSDPEILEAQTDSGDTTGAMGACDRGANLLADGSFEDWVSGSLVQWQDNLQIEQVTADVIDGQSAVRIISPDYQELRQDIDDPLRAGTCLQMCAYIRHDAGHTDSPDFLVQGISDAGADNQFISADWEPDGQWHLVEAGFRLERAADRITFVIVSNESDVGETRFSVDDVILNELDGC